MHGRSKSIKADVKKPLLVWKLGILKYRTEFICSYVPEEA